MGKKTRRRTELEPVTAAVELAERHGFDAGGMLGHDTGTYAVNVTEQVALSVDTVLASVRILADLTADADVGEYHGRERLEDSRLVRRPMASITRRTWLWTVTSTMALYNGCYLLDRFYPERHPDRSPVSLEPVSPSRVSWATPATPHVDGREVPLGSLTYIPRMTFPTVTRELGTILRLAREAFAAAWSADLYRADFWEHGGAPAVVLTSDQVITGPDATTIADRWVERRTASPGRPAVLGQGFEAKGFGADLGTEAAADAASKLGASIARYFGVPAWLLNVESMAGNLTYANASAAGLDLVRYTLQPGYAGPIGDAWSDALPGDYLAGRRVVLGLEHLTRGTQLEQAQTFQIATGNRPWLTPAEVRESLHLPVDRALDEAGTPAPALEVIAT